MMDADEKEIYRYLRAEPGQFVPANSISRHAGGKHKHRESPDWAKAALLRMVERGILETNTAGDYRLKPIPEPDSPRRWVAPQLAEVLRKSGKKFDAVIHYEGDTEQYYDRL